LRSETSRTAVQRITETPPAALQILANWQPICALVAVFGHGQSQQMFRAKTARVLEKS
jgi:hypothetical protein